VIERERVRAAAAARVPLTDGRGQRRVPLRNESINKTLVLLANILDSAVERGGLETNRPAENAAGSKPLARRDGCSSQTS
jgi:hypothetical protein